MVDMEESRSPLHVTCSSKTYSAVKRTTQDNSSLVAEHNYSNSPSLVLSSMEDSSHNSYVNMVTFDTEVASNCNSSGMNVQTPSTLIMELKSDTTIESGMLGTHSLVEPSDQTTIIEMEEGSSSEDSVEEPDNDRPDEITVSGENSTSNAQDMEGNHSNDPSKVEDPEQSDLAIGKSSDSVKLESEMPQLHGILSGMVAKLDQISTTLGHGDTGLVGRTNILETTLTGLYKYVHVKKTGLTARVDRLQDLVSNGPSAIAPVVKKLEPYVEKLPPLENKVNNLNVTINNTHTGLLQRVIDIEGYFINPSVSEQVLCQKVISLEQKLQSATEFTEDLQADGEVGIEDVRLNK